MTSKQKKKSPSRLWNKYQSGSGIQGGEFYKACLVLFDGSMILTNTFNVTFKIIFSIRISYYHISMLQLASYLDSVMWRDFVSPLFLVLLAAYFATGQPGSAWSQIQRIYWNSQITGHWMSFLLHYLLLFQFFKAY